MKNLRTQAFEELLKKNKRPRKCESIQDIQTSFEENKAPGPSDTQFITEIGDNFIELNENVTLDNSNLSKKITQKQNLKYKTEMCKNF